MLFDLIFDVVKDLTDIALGPPTPRMIFFPDPLRGW